MSLATILVYSLLSRKCYFKINAGKNDIGQIDIGQTDIGQIDFGQFGIGQIDIGQIIGIGKKCNQKSWHQTHWHQIEGEIPKVNSKYLLNISNK